MPFGEMTYYAQWRVMRAAKEAGVKVLLDGEGGDEVFGGYAKFRYAYLASLLRSGRWVGLAKEFGATLLQGDRYVLNIRNGYRYLPRQLRRVLGVDSLLREALRGDWDRAVMGESTPATRWWRYASHNGDGASPATVMQRMQVDDIMVDTLPMLLRMEDRSSMAFPLAALVPGVPQRGPARGGLSRPVPPVIAGDVDAGLQPQLAPGPAGTSRPAPQGQSPSPRLTCTARPAGSALAIRPASAGAVANRHEDGPGK